MSHPIFDMHCDLLAYLATVPEADAANTHDIGCALPHLQRGNVKLQVLAMFTKAEPGSSEICQRESEAFRQLVAAHADTVGAVQDVASLARAAKAEKIAVVAAIENAAGFCEQDDSLDEGFRNLERIVGTVGRILYITITHHTENRFGGGNMSENVGLKPDGEALLDYLHDRKIAVDFSHTSDALAEDIFTYISKHNLNIPVLASHSNFRAVFDHKRNLPDEIASEIIRRDGLIAVNFIRAFLNPEDPEALSEHIRHGLELGAGQHLAFGADYFYPGHVPASSQPIYFPAHENAGCYPTVLDGLRADLSEEQLQNLAFGNALRFLTAVWS